MKRNRIYQMRGAVSFSISLLSICAPVPSLSLLPLTLPSFSSSIYQFLSPSPLPAFSLSLSLRMPSSFAPWSRSVSAFIDRSQNDLAHVSYSSWRSGVGGLDFSSLPPSLPPFRTIFSSFPRGATRRDATRRGSTRCGQHPSTAATPRALYRSSTRRCASHWRAECHANKIDAQLSRGNNDRDRTLILVIEISTKNRKDEWVMGCFVREKKNYLLLGQSFIYHEEILQSDEYLKYV